MYSKNWNKIMDLDKERRAIQQRIHIRAAIHHGSSTVMRVDGSRSALTDEDRKSVEIRSIVQDAVDYIHIQDEIWALAREENQYVPPSTRGQSVPG